VSSFSFSLSFIATHRKITESIVDCGVVLKWTSGDMRLSCCFSYSRFYKSYGNTYTICLHVTQEGDRKDLLH
jgi:hypothetical protein